MIIKIRLTEEGTKKLIEENKKSLSLIQKFRKKKNDWIVNVSGFSYEKDFRPEENLLIVRFSDKVKYEHMMLLANGFRNEFRKKGIPYESMDIELSDLSE